MDDNGNDWSQEDQKDNLYKIQNPQGHDEADPMGGHAPEGVVEDLEQEAQDMGIHADDSHGPKILNIAEDLKSNREG